MGVGGRHRQRRREGGGRVAEAAEAAKALSERLVERMVASGWRGVGGRMSKE